MSLADLLTELSTRGAMKPSRVPAMKTSLKYFAAALGHASPEECPANRATTSFTLVGRSCDFTL
jgi:hypothetical protein